MIDRSHIGREFGVHTADIEKGRLRFFAKATGETNPVYFDEEAAKDAGHPTLPAPPTFLFSMDMEVPDPFEILKVMDIDLGKILHGTQEFMYHKPVYAGDTISFKSEVTDIFDKKGGALEFIVKKTSATNQKNELVAEMSRTIVVRNG
ncbi:MaoC family dehydratase N-terminal domain-containing protein [Sneathiella sp.]|uniref:MaoC family dehydratase N-terminal domain-containing protein n=1 Tax=Sneathiella sp. TaxID=1964365 RepID=UPI002618FA73|nr:MaoC family dehydratase N-terminal domain-containing protein [Sneathiella sp.]MDF2366870.1 MaoC family dehydratase N-terminal domain-containing protein [Sneathiella sp.]